MSTETPLRVGVIVPTSGLKGGADMMLLHLIQQGRDLGIEWRLVFLEPGPLIEATSALGVPGTLRDAGRLRQIGRTLSTIGQIASQARRENWDLVMSWVGYAHLYGGPAALLARLPALWYQLGVPSHTWINTVPTRIPARLIMTCSQAMSEMQTHLAPPRPVRTVYPGVELERFDPKKLPSPREARSKLGLPQNIPLIGIVGRLQRWKGMHTLINALPQIQQTHPDARIVIVGGTHEDEPDYEAFLRERITANRVANAVTLAGFQKETQIWMQAMDVVVHASSSEPFGIVVIEGMALGKPVVAAKEGGPLEIITPEQDGLLTPFEDAPALAQAITRLLSDVSLRERLGKAALVRAQEFSTRRYAENIALCCREAVSNGPLPARKDVLS